MALTKIGSIGINTGIAFAGVTTITTLNGSDAVLSVGGTVNFNSDVSIGGSVSIGGTLTYEDVTNIDSVGLITARNGIVVGSGITLSKDGDVFFTGIATGNGSGLTALNASNISSGTVPTARLGSGTASSSTFLAGDSTFKTVTGTTINSNADNRVITGSGTANTLNGESTLTYDSGGMAITGDTDRDGYKITQSGNNYGEFMFNSNRSSANGAIGVIRGEWNSTEVASIYISTGSDTTNKDDGRIDFYTSPASGTGIQNRMSISPDGYVTKPNLPYFYATADPSITSNYVHSFGNVHGNNGSHYNNTLGRFTAPVAGFYWFAVGIWCSNSNGASAFIQLTRNINSSGSEVSFAGCNHTIQYDNLNASGGTYMAKDDFVFIKQSSVTIQPSTPRNFFSGYLVG